tara:strand:- start:4278 stop:4853 length:576 start_codon:yes stop_codon:yes gene_type:complete
MKKIVQFTLFFSVVLALFFFNKKYFSENDKSIVEPIKSDNQLEEVSENNLIKNLKYEINLDQEKNYIITSELSEIVKFNNDEIVKMKIVNAIIIDEKKIPLIIKSDNAEYNNFNFNTKFRNNVSIEYMNNRIFSDKLDLDIKNNIAKIYENVRYIGNDGTIASDNIKVNLNTKKIDIYMNNELDDVKVKKN